MSLGKSGHIEVSVHSARWIPHLLTDEQKRVRVQTSKQLLIFFQSSTKGNLQYLLLETKHRCTISSQLGK